jgi:arylsulfatase B
MTLTIREGVLICVLVLAATGAHARDNFLIIVADDLGVDSVAVYSDDLAYGHVGEGANHGPTPRIDQLAGEGVLFRHAYTNSTCAPTRAQILTGRHALRTGIGTPGGAILDTAEVTIADLLAGTHSNAAIGKWHVGTPDDADHPIDSGFDYFAGSLNGNVSDYEDWVKTINSSVASETVIPNHMVYVTDDNSAEAIAKIAEFDEDPWIVYLAFNAPHSPFHVPTSPLTTAVNAGSSSRVIYEAAVEAMDREIGDVLDSIPTSIMADTTVIFIGDNGTPTGVTRPPFDSTHAKGEVYDGGINVPLIIKSPHAVAGTESLALVHSVDIFATIAEIVGVASTAEDSVSLLPYLADPTTPTQSHRPYAYAEQFAPNGVAGPYTDHQRAIRDEQYKLIWRNGVYEEFFDLTTHPFEDVSLLPYDGMTEEQQAAYDKLLQQMNSIESAGLVACPTEPDPACTTGYLKASFDWRTAGGDGDKATIKMQKGPALVQTDYGDPVIADGTGYSVCVYDDADVLVADMRVLRAGDFCSGKECWKTIGGDVPLGKGYKYKDKLTSSSGIIKMQVKGGDADKSKLKVSGRNVNLPDGVTDALLSTTAATVQVRGSDTAQCLSATMTDISKQEIDRFKVRN